MLNINKPFPALCKDCKYSKPEERSEWNLRCFDPSVNAKDPYALGSANGSGTSCTNEREKSWPAACGMRGARWEIKC